MSELSRFRDSVVKFDIVDSFGDTVEVYPELGLYAAEDFMGAKMPNLGIQLYVYDEDGFKEPYATLTVNFGEFIGMKDCAYIDTNNNSFTAQFLDKGFCRDTGLKKQSGFCTYPLWQFAEDFLKKIDPNGLYEAYSKKYDKYMEQDGILPVEDREKEILQEVLVALDCVDVVLEEDDNGIVAYEYGKQSRGVELYKHILSDFCDFNKDGSIKGLDVDLNVDFKDLCEHNGVKYTDYSNKKSSLDKHIKSAEEVKNPENDKNSIVKDDLQR